MYVCICKAITDCQIKQAIENGADNISAIQQKLGASSECGNCVECIQDMIAEYIVPLSNIKILNNSNTLLQSSNL